LDRGVRYYIQRGVDEMTREKRNFMYEQDEVKNALKVIQSAMKADNPKEPGSYAHSWHCNIAMACHDSILSLDARRIDLARKAGNDAAARFMRICFDVETQS